MAGAEIVGHVISKLVQVLCLDNGLELHTLTDSKSERLKYRMKGLGHFMGARGKRQFQYNLIHTRIASQKIKTYRQGESLLPEETDARNETTTPH